MSPNQWGPPIWTLFHTMIEKIKDDKYSELYPQIFNLIKQVCRELPCPDCSNHATTFLNKVNIKTIQTREDFRMMLFVFHNMVNKRKGKPIFNSSDLEKYASNKLPQVFFVFTQTYNPKLGNLKLMTDTITRKRIIETLRAWFKLNYQSFND